RVRFLVSDIAFLLCLTLVLFGGLERAFADVVQKASCRRERHHGNPDGLGQAFPQLDGGADFWVRGQIVVQGGVICVLEYIHHVCATDALRVIQTGIVITAGLQILNALLSVEFHVLFGTKSNGASRTGLNTGGLLADSYTVRTQGAFVHLVVLFGHTRNIKRTTGNTVAAANAVVLIEIHNPVSVLHDGPGCRAGLQATWFHTVHTAIFADQPLEIAFVVFVLGKTHQRPGLRAEIVGVVIYPDVLANIVAQIVPLHTCDLTGLAPDALRNIDELCHP